MDNLSKRIAALSPKQLKHLKMRLKNEGIDFDTGMKDVKENIYTSMEPVEEKDYYPLSSVQKRLFTLSRLVGDSTIYNISRVKVIEGNLEKERLAEVFKALVSRHKTLRTSFEFIEGEPVQRINKHVEFKIDYIEPAVELKTHTGREKDMYDDRIRGMVKCFVKPFNLSKAPLLRAGILKLSRDRHILMIDMHHIISDATSMRILLNEFKRLYKGQNLHELSIQYKDFSQWRNSEKIKAAMKQQKKYWLKEFEGEIPVLDLSTDYERPVEKSFEGGALYFRIKKKEVTVLKALALKENTTLFVTLLSVYNVLLSKISRQKDIIVGIPIAGRRHTGLNNIIGMFVNTLALRNYPSDEMTFGDFFKYVKQRTLDAFENQDYQFEDLVNNVVEHRDTSRNPIFDVFFSFAYPGVDQELRENLSFDEISDLEVKHYEGEGIFSMFDMYLYGAEVREELFLGITYCAKLFKKETIERFTRYLKEIVSLVVENNRIKLKDIKISHDLGIAGSNVIQDDGEDFGF